jgi:hypothetical protein
VLLSRHYDWARRMQDRLRRRLPKLAGMADRAEAFVTRLGNRLGSIFRR